MIKLKIDGKEIEVAKGTTVLNAAKKLGIEIPTMCYLEGAGFHNHPSCMVCLIKDANSGKLLPSCALPAAENMNIITSDEEVRNARKDSLELLMSDHVGDCEAPCTLGCPAGMNIPLMNRLIEKGDFAEANRVVLEDIALPHILGYICPAPCEKVCRRATIDKPVQICQLKKFVAATDLNSGHAFCPPDQMKTNKKVAVIGSGPAGLASAFYILKSGHSCTIFDKNEKIGGSLRYEQMHKQLPMAVLNSEIEFLQKYGVKFELNVKVDEAFYNSTLKPEYDAIIIATGSLREDSFKIDGLEFDDKGVKINQNTFETSVPGLFACGSALKTLKMAVRSVAQGKETACSVNRFLRGEEMAKEPRMFNSKFGKLAKDEFEDYLKETQHKEMKTQVYDGLDPFKTEDAQSEAGRCLHCDCRKIDDCALRIHSHEYKVDRRKYLSSDRNKVTKHFKQDVIVYEPEKCIKCGLCVEITGTKKEEFGLTFIGRGFDVKIKVPFGKSIDEALTLTAIECAKACPTGAISLIE